MYKLNDRVIIILPVLTEEEKHCYSKDIKYCTLKIINIIEEEDIKKNYSIPNSREKNESIYEVISPNLSKAWVRSGILARSDNDLENIISYYKETITECLYLLNIDGRNTKQIVKNKLESLMK